MVKSQVFFGHPLLFVNVVVFQLPIAIYNSQYTESFPIILVCTDSLTNWPSLSCLCIGCLSRAAMAELTGMEKEGVDGGEGPGRKRDMVVSRLPATPLYNSAVLEDMCMREHLASLHRLCRKSPAFRDAIILGKVMPSLSIAMWYLCVHRKVSSRGAAVFFLSMCD